jgi:murein DD-endopeptidase MepM/ murein hydrolase activator NlpD
VPGKWVAPTVSQFTSGFGPRCGHLHAGVDIASTIGTLILAVAEGTVIVTYGHNNRNLVTVGHVVPTPESP